MNLKNFCNDILKYIFLYFDIYRLSSQQVKAVLAILDQYVLEFCS